jgi:purine-binding chemotaxis protein CheW
MTCIPPEHRLKTRLTRSQPERLLGSRANGEKRVNTGEGKLSLLCRMSSRLCSVSLDHVVETMRPLPIEPLPGTAEFVLGVAIVRGAPMPVIDGARLLRGAGGAPTRFVTLKVGTRHAALAVESVVGIRTVVLDTLESLPPLLGDASADCIERIGALDAELLVVLRSARIVPEEAWAALRAHEAAS